MFAKVEHAGGLLTITLEGSPRVRLLFSWRERYALLRSVGELIAFEGDDFGGYGFDAHGLDGIGPRVFVNLTSDQVKELIPHLRHQPGEVIDRPDLHFRSLAVREAVDDRGTLYLRLGERPGFSLRLRPHERQAIGKAMRVARDKNAYEELVAVEEQGFRAVACLRSVSFEYFGDDFMVEFGRGNEYDEFLAYVEGTAKVHRVHYPGDPLPDWLAGGEAGDGPGEPGGRE